MNIDTPYILQRSIVAYSNVTGTPSAGEWYAATVRRGFGVSSRTAATVTITAGAAISSHIRAAVDGTGIRIECLFDSTASPGTPYGVSGSGVLSIQVVTAGDPAQNLEGTTATFYINVLVLGYDLPYNGLTFLDFRQGQSVNTSLSPVKVAAGDWNQYLVTADGGAASGGQSICQYVNGELIPSGLILHNDNGNMWISGWAATPGVYRVYFDLESTAQGTGGGQVYHPFPGGKGNSSLIIWIYQDYQPGDLVTLLPNPAAGAEGEPQYLAIPFAPAKRGDLALKVADLGGAAILHSLNNRFAGAGSFALLMDGVAGATWKRYPLRRLLSLFSVGATAKMSFSKSVHTISYSEEHNETGQNPEYDNTDDYPDGVPSVGDIQKTAAKQITVGKREDWAKVREESTASASVDVVFPLAYALWSENFPKYLEALLSRAATYSNRQTTYSHDRTTSTKSGGESTTYRIESIPESEAISRGIRFPGDGGAGDAEQQAEQGISRAWYIVAAEVEYIREIWNEDDDELADRSTRKLVYESGTWRTEEVIGTPDALNTPAVSVDDHGMVSISAALTNGRISCSATGYRIAQYTKRRDDEHVDDDPDNPNIIYRFLTVKATASYPGDPGSTDPAQTDPHAGVPDPDKPGYVLVVYSAVQTVGGTETATVGNATTSTGVDFMAHGTATLTFGEGRPISAPHRAIVAAAGGEGGISVNFATANAQRQVQTTTIATGRRERSGGAASWTYTQGTAETWNVPTTTTAIDPTTPETVGGTVDTGETWQTGILALALNSAAMGTLRHNGEHTVGSAFGSVYGWREGGDTPDVPPVSGDWEDESATATGAPPVSTSTGEPLTVSDVDLHGEIDPDEWEQWGYEYNWSETETSAGVQLAITDSEYPAPEQ